MQLAGFRLKLGSYRPRQQLLRPNSKQQDFNRAATEWNSSPYFRCRSLALSGIRIEPASKGMELSGIRMGLIPIRINSRSKSRGYQTQTGATEHCTHQAETETHYYQNETTANHHETTATGDGTNSIVRLKLVPSKNQCTNSKT